LVALGEIALVMIGILIALNIYNWNEERKAKNREIFYLEQLLEDAMVDSIYFASLRLDWRDQENKIIMVKN
jgi:hypothetical protein